MFTFPDGKFIKVGIPGDEEEGGANRTRE